MIDILESSKHGKRSTEPWPLRVSKPFAYGLGEEILPGVRKP